MPDERETTFKVTDRRKFNADGSPRDPSSEPEVEAPPSNAVQEQPSSAEPKDESVQSGSTNAGSLAGDAPKTGDQAAASSPVSAAAPAPAVAANAPSEASPASAAEQSAAEQAFNQAAGPRSAGVPEASFLNLLNMLAVEAAMHLGMIQPQGQEPLPVDLESARHLIDMLGMIKTKTQGNLTGEEEGLLENILADLRMQFVAVSKGR